MFFPEIFALLLGACAGSFLNVCIYRIPRQESVVFKPSHCPECREKLKFWELVPVLSFLVLRGKCRSCGARIALQYPLVEVITAVLFYFSYKSWSFTWQGAAMALFFALLITAAFIDFKHQIIPDKLAVLGIIAGLPLAWLVSADRLKSGLLGFLAAGAIILAIALASRGGMGGGDVKLSAVMGLFLGWPAVLVALFLAFLAGGAVGLFLLATGRKSRKDAVPFGPYLALGGVVSAFEGYRIIEWYLGMVN